MSNRSGEGEQFDGFILIFDRFIGHTLLATAEMYFHVQYVNVDYPELCNYVSMILHRYVT